MRGKKRKKPFPFKKPFIVFLELDCRDKLRGTLSILKRIPLPELKGLLH
jgi:hypothetical protein